MRFKLSVILIASALFFNICLFAQGITNKWIIGYKYSNGTGGNILLDFSLPTLQPQQIQGNLKFLESNASICDRNGDLLFYTNGVEINRGDFFPMSNGAGLNPGPYTPAANGWGMGIAQGQIIIPTPSDSSRYYLFHETVQNIGSSLQPTQLLYSTIDMALDSGRGEVVLKNVPIIIDTLIVGEITACKHGNGRDWWLVCHQFSSNTFITTLITPNGISSPVKQSFGGLFSKGSGGQACFSPNGKQYARYHPADGLDLFDFDRCSGMFGNWKHSDSLTGYGGVAFSSNSKLLYVSAELNLYQFNIADTSQSLDNLKFLVASWDTFYSPNPPYATTFYLAQLAYNGKIYLSSTNGVQHMHVIDHPDSIGISCGVCQHCVSLPSFNSFTIPNIPNYFLGADSGSVCDTLMLSSLPLVAKDEPNLSIFPNPAQDFFFIYRSDAPQESDCFILYNSFGEEVLRRNLQDQPQPISSIKLTAGIYFWRTLSGESGKIILTK